MRAVTLRRPFVAPGPNLSAGRGAPRRGQARSATVRDGRRACACRAPRRPCRAQARRRDDVAAAAAGRGQVPIAHLQVEELAPAGVRARLPAPRADVVVRRGDRDAAQPPRRGGEPRPQPHDQHAQLAPPGGVRVRAQVERGVDRRDPVTGRRQEALGHQMRAGLGAQARLPERASRPGPRATWSVRGAPKRPRKGPWKRWVKLSRPTPVRVETAVFQAFDGETRTRTGDTTIFSRVAQPLEFVGFAGDSRGFGIAWPSRTFSDLAVLSRLLGPTGRLVGLFARPALHTHRQPGSWHSRRRR
jgi:hypothetical protein